MTYTPAEDRFVLGVAYQAGPDPLIKRGADGKRDFFTERELELASRTFLRKSALQAGILHVPGTETQGHVEIVESYIYRGPDWPQPDGTIIKRGDWLVGAILDEPTWKAAKDGKFTGWSVQGTGKRRSASA